MYLKQEEADEARNIQIRVPVLRRETAKVERVQDVLMLSDVGNPSIKDAKIHWNVVLENAFGINALTAIAWDPNAQGTLNVVLTIVSKEFVKARQIVYLS